MEQRSQIKNFGVAQGGVEIGEDLGEKEEKNGKEVVVVSLALWWTSLAAVAAA